jgi:hypothetical protein
VYLRFDYFSSLAAMVTSASESVAMAQGENVSLQYGFTVVLARFQKYANTLFVVVYYRHRLRSGGLASIFGFSAWCSSRMFILRASQFRKCKIKYISVYFH